MQHLVGLQLPNVVLRTSNLADFNPSESKGRAVYFCYPYTGRPSVPNPPDWDNIQGAHGSTPQALGYKALHKKFSSLKVEIYGLSLLSEEWISDFATRNALPYLLLSDQAEQFSNALHLPRFKAGSSEFLHRITLICLNNTIVKVIYPIENPEHDARETLGLLASP